MDVLFSEDGWNDYLFWQQSDQKMLEQINAIIKDIVRDPFRGIGKPEPLKANYTGFWSRRINHEHRLIYKVEKNTLKIVKARFHYLG